jgi:hypothetical protein
LLRYSFPRFRQPLGYPWTRIMPFPALRQGPTLLFTLDSARSSDKFKLALGSIDFLSLT